MEERNNLTTIAFLSIRFITVLSRMPTLHRTEDLRCLMNFSQLNPVNGSVFFKLLKAHGNTAINSFQMLIIACFFPIF